MTMLLEHGGCLQLAARQFGIPAADWLDLSTGINPNGWPVPPVPAECWLRLPEEQDELLPAARAYYGNSSLLAVAGSQAAIQTLPRLRPQSRVGFLHPAYAEHAGAWQRAGHQVTALQVHALESALPALDVLILINPNNPTGCRWPIAQLSDWHGRLQQRGGWLIVDEAFIDTTPELSLSPLPVKPGLIVLRSLGKFFGLAGIRCGFVIAETAILQRLAAELGPWAISHPARYAAARALKDTQWQRETAIRLKLQSRRLTDLLSENGWPPSGGCDLFQWIETEYAGQLHRILAEQAILTRLFSRPASVRLGLPKDEPAWRRLQHALAHPGVLALQAVKSG
ncbi:threonine-phosphate decarboxylase CobD [Methylomonas rhizoryzae]|uniref:threonine-phosphate decarboxylase CobD n=1 Tax=Methylomonas rhizoryzae TaxID=2608981 RepID=UPI001E6543B5|nr:threonine-phosphate decarboxylase CobD [Methylomonas rhizoryzae]